jgi:hypothetical protein
MFRISLFRECFVKNGFETCEKTADFICTFEMIVGVVKFTESMRLLLGSVLLGYGWLFTSLNGRPGRIQLER